MGLPRQTYRPEAAPLADNAARAIASLERRLDDFLYAADYGAWEDLTFPTSGAPIPGGANDPDRDPNTGFLLFSPTVNETQPGVGQNRHARKPDSPFRPHLHLYAAGSSPSGGTTDSMWRLEYKIVNIGDAIPSAYQSADILITHPAHRGSDPIFTAHSFPEVDGVGYRDSVHIIWKLTRLATDALDTYGGDVCVVSFDVHYLRSRLGSRQEIPTSA